MTPDHRDIVEQVHREHPELLQVNTIESCGRFTRLCAARLHALDPNWGLLTKNPGQTQYDGYAVDAIIYKSSGQVVDIIAGAHNPPHPGRPAWLLVGRDPSNRWAPPVGGTEEPQPPAAGHPPPEPCSGHAALEAELAAVRAGSAALAAELEHLRRDVSAAREELRVVSAEVERLKTAWNAPWRVRGGTSRDAYHSHQIDLVVIRES